MTIDEERAMLARMVETPLEAYAELGEKIQAQLGVAYVDQGKAAGAESTKRAVAFQRNMGGLDEAQGDPAIYPYLLAGVFRCILTHACAHSKSATVSVNAYLAPRAIFCERCAAKFLPHLVASDARVSAGLDHTCDFCLEDKGADGQFSTVTVPFGAALVIGDMCQPCWHRFRR